MKLLAALLLAPALALADGEPPVFPEGHSHVALKGGQPVPSDGVFADLALAKYDVNRLLWVTAERDACREVVKAQPFDFGPYLKGGAVGLIVGVVVGVIVRSKWGGS